MRKLLALSVLGLLGAASAQASGPQHATPTDTGAQPAKRCSVTTSARPLRRYGGSHLWVMLPRGGVLRAQKNDPDDGTLSSKLGWIPDRDRGVRLTVGGRRLDAPGRMVVHRVSWGYSSTGKGSWASAVSFPEAGCWRLTGRAGPATVSYVVRVVSA